RYTLRFDESRQQRGTSGLGDAIVDSATEQREVARETGGDDRAHLAQLMYHVAARQRRRQHATRLTRAQTLRRMRQHDAQPIGDRESYDVDEIERADEHDPAEERRCDVVEMPSRHCLLRSET